MPPIIRPTDVVNPDDDYGKSADSLSATLRSSKWTSEMFDPPLPPMREPLQKYWLCRFYVALASLANVSVSFTEQAMGREPSGHAWLIVMTVLGLIGLGDVMVNDLMKPRWEWRRLRDFRHWVYMALAVGTMGLTYAMVRDKGFTPVLLVYWVNAAFAVSVAPLDLFARHRGT